MTLFQYFSLFAAAGIGALLAFYFQKSNTQLLKWVLSFSGAYLLGVTFLHLLPETYENGGASMGFWVLAGFLIQILLDQLTQGVEHGHIHAHTHESGRFAATVLVGISIHALMEGLPLDGFGLHNNHAHHQLLWGVLMHKPPEAFALTLLLLSSGYSRRVVIGCSLLFASVSPLGAWLGAWLENTQLLGSNGTVYIMALVIGSFFHIATTILYENEGNSSHHISWQRLAAILLGIGIATLTMH
jgi:zinc transporter ZupT